MNEALFPSLNHVRATLAAWRKDDNTERPHSRLGWQRPSEFGQTFTPQRGLTLRNPKSSAPTPSAEAPVAQPPKQAKLKPGVSLTLDKSWGQRHCETREPPFEHNAIQFDLPPSGPELSQGTRR